MTDDEIRSRLPDLHPYLVRPLGLRLLRPVALGSPEFHFAVSLLFVVAGEPERSGPSVWPEIASDAAREADPAFVQRCYRIVQHVKDKLERRTALLLKRLGQTDGVLEVIGRVFPSG